MITSAVQSTRRVTGAALTTQLVHDAAEWDGWIDELTHGSILQSYYWGEFKSRFGWELRRLLIRARGRPIGAAQVLIRQTPVATIAYVPRGPLLAAETPGEAGAVLEGLHTLARDEGATFLKIEPEIRNSPEAQGFFLDQGFRPSEEIQPRSTLIVDLRGDVETLRSRLSTRIRYNVSLASRWGVTVVQGGAADLASFYQLLEVANRRRGFIIHSLDYYEDLWSLLEASGMVKLFLAVYDDELLAAALLLVAGTRAYYMYGASNGKYRNLKPNDLLQWEAMRWAQAHGCVTYDLWGIPDVVGEEAEAGTAPDASDRSLWGAFHFKRGFGGAIVRYVGAFDYVYSPARYWLWQALMPQVRQAVTLLRGGEQQEQGWR